MASYRPLSLLSLYLILLALVFHVTQAIHEAKSDHVCCSECIGKPSQAPYNYDPLIFDQCTAIKPAGVCCFECGNLGEPSYGDTVSYGNDGVTAVVKAGTFISFTWNGVVNVTYVSLKTGQKKTVTPTVSDAEAMKKSDTFLICAKSAGTIYFRGWGSDTCTEASPEHSVTIEKGDSGSDTCDANDVKVPLPSSSSDSDTSSTPADATVKNCNQQRASVQTVDGTRTCVCVSDWTNPPECDRWPLWKWLVTIGGGVAALFSIIISVRALVGSRKKKQEKEEYQSNVVPMGSKSCDIESMQVTPDNDGQGTAMASYKYNPEADRTNEGARKDDREFTL
ncbi:unnamed protein product [Peronospora farinosa]|uniref:Uncharacterized protein n=1 Tax=Peronospora farinosa TaxID=134698 RepID=A0AAV0URQ9_9STRA|nr:unnamed protein product [Peronospora farinosa]CAI5739565.1 unnamed protein product [Peronospora farinosa]